jgi:tetratricopeptide (TPR) repeat protein
VRARRGPRRERDPTEEQAKIEARTLEQWVDEGPVRAEATAAARRAGERVAPRRSRRAAAPVDEAVGRQIAELVGGRRAERLTALLSEASDALARDRFAEARRISRSVLDELSTVSTAHRIAGVSAYRLGRWREAVAELEVADELEHSAEHRPVLADAYRALRRWKKVDEIWAEIRAASPAHEVMAEGRIVAAGAAADRGDLPGAIAIMEPATKTKGRVRDHHLRQWYVLADLHDRAGDPIASARLFQRVADHDPEFVDVRARLDALGR